MKTNLRYITIIIGCLLAVVIVCSQVYSTQCKSVDTEQSEGEDQQSDAASISMASFSLPSPVNVQINLDPHCLFEIVFENAEAETPVDSDSSIEEKFFLTLFRVIIAPNAP